MNTYSNLIRKKVENFMSRPKNDVINKINEYGEVLSLHTLKLILYPEYQTVDHWKDEILTWLDKCKKLNRVRTSEGKLKYSILYDILHDNNLYSEDDIYDKIKSLISKYGKSDKLINGINFNSERYDRFHEALMSIYDDYIKYIRSEMSIKELENRIKEYWV